MSTRRTQRVGENIREVLGDLIQRQVKDPRVGFVTITAVRVTPDLSRAHIYYTVLGDDKEQRDTQAGLESAKPYLRTETGRRVHLKTTPDLEFHLDDAPEKGQHVDTVIEEIHRAEGLSGMQLPPVPTEIATPLGAAIDAIEAATSIGIACHIRPDGDALGCLLAIALALKEKGIPIQPTWDGETVTLPAALDFLPGADLLVPTNDFRPPDLSIAVDCATIDRLGRLGERMKKAKNFINIDHHVSNTKFGKINVVDTNAASSAEIVVQLLSRLGTNITPEIATCLYTGVVTDTGRFGYQSTSPRTHATAAFLIQRGAEVAAISQQLYENAPFTALKVIGRALDRLTLETEPVPFVFTYLTQADLKEFGVLIDDTDDVIDYVRAAREADVAVLLKELPDGTFKGSFRSKGATDVGAVAQALGGGGHTLAAGYEVPGPLDAALATVRAALKDAQSA